MDLYGTPDTLAGRIPCLRGLAKAEEFVFNLYFEHEAWDVLVAHFVYETTATVWSIWPWSLRLRDALVERRDVRRRSGCWRRRCSSGWWCCVIGRGVILRRYIQLDIIGWCGLSASLAIR